MELSEIRTRIDAVDDQMLQLFLERMQLAEEVAAYKMEHHLPILNRQREREVLAKVMEKAGDKERYAYHLYSTLFELSRARQAELYSAPCENDAAAAGMVADSGDHATRFSCITKDPVIYSGADRIGLVITVENKPGALCAILSKLAALDINMTKLESWPVPGGDFECSFFLELDACVQDPGVLAMLEEMKRCCTSFSFLGSYAEI